LEIENDHLNEVVQNSVNDLDFDSFKEKELSFNFDLPLSGCNKLETKIFEVKNCENDEVVNNLEFEKKVNEHEFFGLYDDELSNEFELESSHQSEFENFIIEEIPNEHEIVSVKSEISTNEIGKCDHIVLNNTRRFIFVHIKVFVHVCYFSEIVQ